MLQLRYFAWFFAGQRTPINNDESYVRIARCEREFKLSRKSSNLRREPMLTRVKNVFSRAQATQKKRRKKYEKGLLPEFDRRYIAIIFAARKGAVDGQGHPSNSATISIATYNQRIIKGDRDDIETSLRGFSFLYSSTSFFTTESCSRLSAVPLLLSLALLFWITIDTLKRVSDIRNFYCKINHVNIFVKYISQLCKININIHQSKQNISNFNLQIILKIFKYPSRKFHYVKDTHSRKNKFCWNIFLKKNK